MLRPGGHAMMAEVSDDSLTCIALLQGFHSSHALPRMTQLCPGEEWVWHQGSIGCNMSPGRLQQGARQQGPVPWQCPGLPSERRPLPASPCLAGPAQEAQREVPRHRCHPAHHDLEIPLQGSPCWLPVSAAGALSEMLMWMLRWCQMGGLLAYRAGQRGEAELVASLPVQAQLPLALQHAHLQWPAAEHIYT